MFEQDERSPVDDLRLQFEAVSQLQPEDQAIVRDVLESLVMKYQAKRWEAMRTAAAAPKAAGKAPARAAKRAAHAAR